MSAANLTTLRTRLWWSCIFTAYRLRHKGRRARSTQPQNRVNLGARRWIG